MKWLDKTSNVCSCTVQASFDHKWRRVKVPHVVCACDTNVWYGIDVIQDRHCTIIGVLWFSLLRVSKVPLATFKINVSEPENRSQCAWVLSSHQHTKHSKKFIAEEYICGVLCSLPLHTGTCSMNGTMKSACINTSSIPAACRKPFSTATHEQLLSVYRFDISKHIGHKHKYLGHSGTLNSGIN